MRRTMALCAMLLLGGCGFLKFGRPLSTDELVLQQQIKSFYAQVQRSFAVGNAQSLATLFDPSISHPMSHREIEAWADKFFSEHGHAAFHLNSLEFDSLGFSEAVVTMRYRVQTPDGNGSFGGTERDALVKRKGRWYIASWDKVDDK